jgi:branched-chain amino acid transport system substrate-binding protein
MRLKSLSIVGIAMLAISVIPVVSATAATTAKAGAACKSSGTKAMVGTKSLQCKSVKGKLVWTASATAPVATAPVATACKPLPANAPVYKVGVQWSITGALAVYGIAEKQATDLAIKQANKCGVNGRKIEQVFYDPAGDVAKGVEYTNRLIQQDKVDFLVGGATSSGIALAIKAITQGNDIFFMSAEASAAITDPVTASPLTFSTTISTDVVASKMMNYLKSKGIKSIAVANSSSVYGTSGATSLKAAAATFNIKFIGEQYDEASTDLTSVLRKLADEKPGAIINWTSGTTGLVYFKNASDLELSKSMLVMSSFTYSNPALMKQVGDASKNVIVAGIKGTLLASLTPSDPDYKNLKEFADDLDAEFKVPITIYAAQAYDAMMIALSAVEVAKSTDGGKMADAVEKLTHAGVQGTYRFSGADHRGLGGKALEMMQWDGTKFVRLS